MEVGPDRIRLALPGVGVPVLLTDGARERPEPKFGQYSFRSLPIRERHQQVDIDGGSNGAWGVEPAGERGPLEQNRSDSSPSKRADDLGSGRLEREFDADVE
jgi:hypothetical protein